MFIPIMLALFTSVLLVFLFRLRPFRVWWKCLLAGFKGKHHAAIEEFAPREVGENALGPPPVIDTGDPTYVAHQAALGVSSEEVKTQQEAQRVEEELAKYANPWLVLACIIGVFILQVTACLQIVKGMGVAPGIQRVLLALLLATILALLAYYASKGASAGPLAGRGGRPLWWYATIAALLLTEFAIMLIRTLSVHAKDQSAWFLFATGCLMQALSLGGSLLLEKLFRLLEPTLPLLRRLGVFQRRLGRFVAKRLRARAYLASLTRRVRNDEEDRTKIITRYTLAYRETTAEIRQYRAANKSTEPPASSEAENPYADTTYN